MMEENTYAVSIDIKASNGFTGQELCKYLELMNVIEPELREYLGPKDDKHEYWIFESRLDESDSLENHFADLASLVNFDKPFEPDERVKGLLLNIGVFFYTPICVMRISPECLKIIQTAWPGIDIEFSCYYCVEEDEVD